jgi:hypothetical protein
MVKVVVDVSDIVAAMLRQSIKKVITLEKGKKKNIPLSSI